MYKIIRDIITTTIQFIAQNLQLIQMPYCTNPFNTLTKTHQQMLSKSTYYVEKADSCIITVVQQNTVTQAYHR